MWNPFKPKWKHGNSCERLEAIDSITSQEKLMLIVKDDIDSNIKEKALNKITDQKLLHDLILNIDDEKLKKLAVDKISDQEILKKLAKAIWFSEWKEYEASVKHNEFRLEMAEMERRSKRKVGWGSSIVEPDTRNLDLHNEFYYAHRLLHTESNSNIQDDCKSKLNELTDKHESIFLTALRKINSYFKVYPCRINNIKNQSLLKNVFKFSSNDKNRYEALAMINGVEYLEYLARNDTDDEVRRISAYYVASDDLFELLATIDSSKKVRGYCISQIKNDGTLHRVNSLLQNEGIYEIACKVYSNSSCADCGFRECNAERVGFDCPRCGRQSRFFSYSSSVNFEEYMSYPEKNRRGLSLHKISN